MQPLWLLRVRLCSSATGRMPRAVQGSSRKNSPWEMKVSRIACVLLLAAAGASCSAAEGSPAFAAAPLISRLRGGGMPQFWANQQDLKNAPERWSGGFAKLRAMCGGTSEEEPASRGKWTKVDTVGQEKAMLMLGLNVVFRKAAILLSTVVIKSDPKAFEVNTKGALVVSIKERYAFDGSVSECSRRDKRWGSHKGKIVEATETKVVLDVTWSDPHGGKLTETFEVDKTGNKMTQTSKILVNEDATTGKKPTEAYTYYSVYERV